MKNKYKSSINAEKNEKIREKRLMVRGMNFSQKIIVNKVVSDFNLINIHFVNFLTTK
jgi:hypothetical protein